MATTTLPTIPPLPTATAPTRPASPSPPPLTDALLVGDEGPRVRVLQERLDALGYWLGPVDGVYGTDTAHAVTAFQKAAGLGRDGVAGPDVVAALAAASRLVPRTTDGHAVEVDLVRQVVIVADGGRATWVLDACTGAVAGTTPTGRHEIRRQVDGFDYGPYGPLYRPRYFTGTVALHGYPSVPATPASHGSVRVTNAAIDLLWAADAAAVGTPVVVY